VKLGAKPEGKAMHGNDLIFLHRCCFSPCTCT
jgi:hypothetical protein